MNDEVPKDQNEEPGEADPTESNDEGSGGFDLDLDGFDVSGQPDQGPVEDEKDD